MTQEHKELLLKDLCARLPYKTKIQLTEYSVTEKKLPSEIKILDYCMLGKVQAYCKGFRKDEIRPYLFPLSSMTEEQKIEEYKLMNSNFYTSTVELPDFYNKNHIDYRGLIPLGLAIDATDKNIY